LIAGEIDRMVYYYILNEHGDVTQLWSQSGTCKVSYEYDDYGIERNLDKEDENPFLYRGEYYSIELNSYYLRSLDNNTSTGRFLTEDTYWNVNNMIYGDNPVRIKERKDPLGFDLQSAINLFK
jgi:hypothetical protein